ncbi:MAG: DNA repair protein RecO [Chitinivibrionales bacterium]|nr:DNA repair protein RecO [Chitinivibrionales bacterium]
MPGEKTTLIILDVHPWRESSFLVYCFSHAHGLLHCLAKGIRRAKKTGTVIERGSIVEALVYSKPGRELHTLGSIQPALFFKSIRTDLGKSALRDVAFEIMLKSVRDPDPHPELYDALIGLLTELNASEPATIFPFALWRWIDVHVRLLGYGIDTRICARCGADHLAQTGGTLHYERGAIVCSTCSEPGPARYLPPASLRVLGANKIDERVVKREIAAAHALRITRLLIGYCGHHFEFRAEAASLAFLEDVFGVCYG